MVNIFDTVKPRGTFMKFENIGDQVQGTYIDKYDGVDSFGNDQVIIVLKGEEDKIWNIGIKKYQKALLDQVEPATFGQIVGFRFEAIVPSKSKPGKMAKIINFAHQKDIVDEVWLKEQADKAVENLEDLEGTEPIKPAIPTEKKK